jgi:hypothetical protein
MAETPHGSAPDNSVNGSAAWKFPVILGVIALLLMVGLTLLGVFLLRHPDLTRTLRDLVIIVFALEILVIGVALTVVAVQLARLLHLLRHEIKPILEQASDTIGMLRGTARLVNENVAAPVMKLSGTLAGALRFLRMLWPERDRSGN